jgi:protein-S-isoprenylcysteine O-methyltransferase Ste14
MLDKILKSKVWSVLGQFIYTVLVLLGLPILVWGTEALPVFFANPVRLTFSVVVLGQALISAWLVAITPPEPPHEHRFDLTHWHSHMFEAIVALAAFGDERSILTWNQNNVVRWVGLGVYLTGLALSIWSNFSWIKHLRTEAKVSLNHPVLISEGPYKLIRYPSFLYLIFYALGFALIFRSGIGMALMIPLLGGILNRINSLEKIFAEEYKKIWPLRRHTSKRLIPYLY